MTTTDTNAPHYPLSIPRTDQFEHVDLLRDLDRLGEPTITAIFGELFAGLDERLEWLG